MNMILGSVQANSSHENRRSEDRFAVSGEAIVQIVESENEDLVGTTFRSAITDVSRGGMRLACKEFIENAGLELCINLDGLSDKLWLKTEVRWASWENDEEYELGIEILDRSVTDSSRWFELWD